MTDPQFEELVKRVQELQAMRYVASIEVPPYEVGRLKEAMRAGVRVLSIVPVRLAHNLNVFQEGGRPAFGRTTVSKGRLSYYEIRPFDIEAGVYDDSSEEDDFPRGFSKGDTHKPWFPFWYATAARAWHSEHYMYGGDGRTMPMRTIGALVHSEELRGAVLSSFALGDFAAVAELLWADRASPI